MEVVENSSNDYFEFNYDSRILPYLSAPSSPKRFGEMFTSAPTSPSIISDFYSEFQYFSISSPTPKAAAADDDNDGFAFFVGESENSFHSAEELFDGGRIKPLNEFEHFIGKKLDGEVNSRREKNESDKVDNNGESETRRGRDRTPSSLASSNSGRRRVTRSHSPYIEPHDTWIEESQHESNKEDFDTKASLSTPKSARKWRFRDLLLFRSVSEGSGTSKNSLGKYPFLFKRGEEGKVNSSFRSSNNIPPRSRRNETISPHELHYARKKAETEDLKKKTFLPYNQGILGRLAGYRR